MTLAFCIITPAAVGLALFLRWGIKNKWRR